MKAAELATAGDVQARRERILYRRNPQSCGDRWRRPFDLGKSARPRHAPNRHRRCGRIGSEQYRQRFAACELHRWSLPVQTSCFTLCRSLASSSSMLRAACSGNSFSISLSQRSASAARTRPSIAAQPSRRQDDQPDEAIHRLRNRLRHPQVLRLEPVRCRYLAREIRNRSSSVFVPGSKKR